MSLDWAILVNGVFFLVGMFTGAVCYRRGYKMGYRSGSKS